MNNRRRATRFRGQCHELFALAEEEQVAPDEERAGVQVDGLVKAAWISLSVPALRILSCNPLDPRHFLNVR
jgi:hypothetical protein